MSPVYTLLAPSSQLLAPSAPPGQVLSEEQPAFSRTDEIGISITVHVDDGNLDARADAAAVVHEMADPLDGRRSALRVRRPGPGARRCRLRAELIPVHAERLAFSRIAAVVGHEPLAGDQIEPAVAVQIRERGGVPLGPGRVDGAANPFAPLAVLEPEHAVIVAGGRDDVVATRSE